MIVMCMLVCACSFVLARVCSAYASDEHLDIFSFQTSYLQCISIWCGSELPPGNYTFSVPANSGVSLPLGGLAPNDPRLKIGVAHTTGVVVLLQKFTSSPRVEPLPPTSVFIPRNQTNRVIARDGVSGLLIQAYTFDVDMHASIGISALDVMQTPVEGGAEVVGDVLSFQLDPRTELPRIDVNVTVRVPSALVYSRGLRRLSDGMQLGQFWFDTTSGAWVQSPTSQVLPKHTVPRHSHSASFTPRTQTRESKCPLVILRQDYPS